MKWTVLVALFAMSCSASDDVALVEEMDAPDSGRDAQDDGLATPVTPDSPRQEHYDPGCFYEGGSIREDVFMKGFQDICHAGFSIEAAVKEQRPFGRLQDIVIGEFGILSPEGPCRFEDMSTHDVTASEDGVLSFMVESDKGNPFFMYIDSVMRFDTFSREFSCDRTKQLIPNAMRSSVVKVYDEALLFSLDYCRPYTGFNQVGWYMSGWDGPLYLKHFQSPREYAAYFNNNPYYAVQNILTIDGQILSYYMGNIVSIDSRMKKVNWIINEAELNVSRIFLDEDNSYSVDGMFYVRALDKESNDVFLRLDSCGGFDVIKPDSFHAPERFCYQDRCVSLDYGNWSRATVTISNLERPSFLCDDFLVINESKVACVTVKDKSTLVTVIDLAGGEDRELVMNEVDRATQKYYTAALSSMDGVFVLNEKIYDSSGGVFVVLSFVDEVGVLLKQLRLDMSGGMLNDSSDRSFILLDGGELFFPVSGGLYHVQTNLSGPSDLKFSRTFGYNNRNTMQPAY